MSTVYSTRFLAVGSGTTVSYTVPAGYVAVVRSITAALVGNPAQGAFQVSDTTAGVPIASGVLPPTNAAPWWASMSINMRYVATAGSVLQGVTQAGLYVTVSGYLLSLP